jgi:hypothetical protein
MLIKLNPVLEDMLEDMNAKTQKTCSRICGVAYRHLVHGHA